MFEEAKKERFFILSPNTFYVARSYDLDAAAGDILPGDTLTLNANGKLVKTGTGAASEGPLFIALYPSKMVPGGGTVGDEKKITVVFPMGNLEIATTNYDPAVASAAVGSKVVMKDGTWHLFDNTVDSVYHGIITEAPTVAGETVYILWKGVLV